MPLGTLEVLLVGAKGLESTDVISKMDPYAILTCWDQEKKSNIAAGQGKNPEWNETLLFSISDGIEELKIKIMDKDDRSRDDFVGETTIPLGPVFCEGSIPPTAYNVMKDKHHRGEIKVGLVFKPQETWDMEFSEEEEFRGWQ